MISGTVALLGIWLVMVIAPQTPIGRWLSRALVEAPAARLSRIHRGQILLAVILVGVVSGLIWLIGHESVRLLAMGAPDIAMMISTFEVTTYLDAFVAIAMTSSTGRLAGVGPRLRSLLTRPMRHVARARKTRPAGGKKPANDDDHPAPLSLAA